MLCSFSPSPFCPQGLICLFFISLVLALLFREILFYLSIISAPKTSVYKIWFFFYLNHCIFMQTSVERLELINVVVATKKTWLISFGLCHSELIRAPRDVQNLMGSLSCYLFLENELFFFLFPFMPPYPTFASQTWTQLHHTYERWPCISCGGGDEFCIPCRLAAFWREMPSFVPPQFAIDCVQLKHIRRKVITIYCWNS